MKTEDKKSSASQKQKNKEDKAILDDSRAIAIDANASGFQELREYFNDVPADCHYSFIFIQHPSPEGKSVMANFFPKNIITSGHKVLKDVRGSLGQRILELEEELKSAKENLNEHVRNMETRPEKSKVTYEYLRKVNAGLQSANEDLHSINSALVRENNELQKKTDAFASINADIDNLVKRSEVAIIFLDRDFRIRRITPSITKHFNITADDISRPIHHFANNLAADASTLEMLSKVLSTGEPMYKEINPLGGCVFHKKISPYINSQNEIDGVVISFVDITELKESQRKIVKKSEELKLLFENAPEMFATYDLNGKCISCNWTFARKLGYDNPDEVIGVSVKNLYVKSESKDLKKRLEAFKKVGFLKNVERLIRKKDGTVINISVNAQVLKDAKGEPQYIIASMRDMNEIFDIRNQLMERNSAFEQLLEGTMAGYWDWMIQDGTEYLSPSLKQMLGYKDHEIKNTHKAWQKILHPEDLDTLQECFKNHAKTKGELPYDNQLRFYHKDGSIVWVYHRGKVIEWDKNDQPVRMVGSNVDITPLKVIEEELLRSNRELEQFAYVASHDLQEPLNTISDFVRLFQDEYEDKFDDTAMIYCDYILKASNRMSSLVKGVLGYSRIGRSKEIEQIDFTDMLKVIEDDLSAKIKDTGTKIEYSNLPIINGYRMEIHSLAMNLILNSIKYRRKDVKPVVKITAIALKKHWQFSFEDNGIGIAKINQEKVFMIFQRLNNMDSYDGTGIGLAQCKKIVELHHGDIRVESKLEEGSKFIFKLKKM